MIPDHLRIQPGQEALTLEQEAEAKRFAQERIEAQLSTEPVDEPEAEALLRQEYAVVGLTPPHSIHWVDGPLQMLEALPPASVEANVEDRMGYWLWVSVQNSIKASVPLDLWRLSNSVDRSVYVKVGRSVAASLWASLEGPHEGANASESRQISVEASVRGYRWVEMLAKYRFFDEYLESNELSAIARFNELVSGYWLGQDLAIIVRRPRLLARDAQGRLHSATGKCVEYRDGWGFYAWHGVLVPAKALLHPDLLTREEMLREPNLWTRHVMYERQARASGLPVSDTPTSQQDGSRRVATHLKLEPEYSSLVPNQQAELTPEQRAKARSFAAEHIRAQLSTEPVDEAEAEAWLRATYQAAGHVPPRQILWLDGPLPLLHTLLWGETQVEQSRWGEWIYEEASVKAEEASAKACLGGRLWDSVGFSVETHIGWGVGDTILASAQQSWWASVQESEEITVKASLRRKALSRLRKRMMHNVRSRLKASVAAYYNAGCLAKHHFLDAYLAPSPLHPWAHFNELVSGYLLGRDTALLVHRPRVLARDARGRLHSATGKCVEYRDGWGFYAWHGVRVPEQVILAPETLTREDFLNAPNVEVRRVIQERMGSRFVSELGGIVIDTSPRGTLYEVALPDDPERVARYVQVQDASTERQYFMRVPPTIQTAAEAVAWTFQVGAEDYRPALET